jgi:hypothetical protein
LGGKVDNTESGEPELDDDWGAQSEEEGSRGMRSAASAKADSACLVGSASSRLASRSSLRRAISVKRRTGSFTGKRSGEKSPSAGKRPEAEVEEALRRCREPPPFLHDGRWGKATLEVCLAMPRVSARAEKFSYRKSAESEEPVGTGSKRSIKARGESDADSGRK